MLERYEIEKEISYGGFKRVFLAVDSETKKQVVIKVLYSQKPFSEGDLKHLATEAEALKNLSHPNVPHYLDYFDEGLRDDDKRKGMREFSIKERNRRDFLGGNHSAYALVQDYVDAPSLAELIDQGVEFSETETIQLAKAILNILDYLHGLNPPVIHQNLKPSNILLNNRSGNRIGDLYLVNFSLEDTPSEKKRKKQNLNSSCNILITPSYISYEQKLTGIIGFDSDLYSLGMTLICLVTNTDPSSLPRSKDTGKVILDRSQVSRSFSHWLNKTAHPVVKYRYQSAAVALEALDSVNAGKFLCSKPKSSQIKVRIDRQKLEIIYPTLSPKNDWRRLYLSVMFVWLYSIATQSVDTFVYILFLIFFALYFVYRKLRKYEIIRITKNPPNITESFYQGILTKFIHKKRKKTARRPIEQVIYRPSYTSDEYHNRSKWSASKARTKIDAKLSLSSNYYSRIEVFSLQEVKTKTVKITEADLLWLGDEISEFLDLRLRIVNQTSKVTSTSNLKK